MKVVFIKECAADGCYKKKLSGFQMCEKHEKMYNDGIPFKAYYGKTVQKKEFQNK